MKLSDFTTDDIKDKVENIKQVKQEIQKTLHSRIIPHENHTLFEVNLKDKTIKKAVYDKLNVISWEDAYKGYIKGKKELTISEDCIYISCLNIKNLYKILKRDYNITNKFEILG
jgi:hypothetical protein